MNLDLLGKKMYKADYQSAALPQSVRIWKPLVYQDGASYKCCFPEYPWNYIKGCGQTPELAMEDWARDLSREMETVTGFSAGHA